MYKGAKKRFPDNDDMSKLWRDVYTTVLVMDSNCQPRYAKSHADLAVKHFKESMAEAIK